MAGDGRCANAGLRDTAFRHPGLSANYVDCDGHAELLRSIEVDGYNPGFSPVYVIDKRINYKQ